MTHAFHSGARGTTSRRQLLRTGLASTFGAWLATGLTGRAFADPPDAPLPVRAKACIVLWMNGGPSHLDTFDPKGGKVAGPFKAIDTRAAGVRICEHLPQVAEQADKLAVVRSLTTKEGNHERASHLLHTGYAPSPTVAYPALGAWISARTEPGALPSFVSLAGPAAGAGFLGVDHAPFVMRDPSKPPDNLAYGVGVDEGRFRARMGALEAANARFGAQAPAVARTAVYRKASAMMHAAEIDAFDLAAEPQAVRTAYGDTPFGNGCLLARRLVERGVRVVEVTLDGWDTHADGFDRTKKLMGALDPAMASLVRDLHERGRLADTMVVWMGEFGRTPVINEREGRDHHPRAFSAVLAGGGIRGGIAYGKTDETGDAVVDKPVAVADLHATIAVSMGVDPSQSAYAPGGRPVTLTDRGSAIRDLMT